MAERHHRGFWFVWPGVGPPHVAAPRPMPRSRVPTYCAGPGPFDLSGASAFKKLGVKACRVEAGFTPSAQRLRHPQIEISSSSFKRPRKTTLRSCSPSSRAAPRCRSTAAAFLNDDNSMKDKGKFDLAWLPDQDEGIPEIDQDDRGRIWLAQRHYQRRRIVE